MLTLESAKFGIDNLVRLYVISKRTLWGPSPFFFGYPHQVWLDVVPDDLADEASNERFMYPNLDH